MGSIGNEYKRDDRHHHRVRRTGTNNGERQSIAGNLYPAFDYTYNLASLTNVNDLVLDPRGDE